MEKSRIMIEGHRGTWYVIDEKQKVILDEVWNGFSDLEEM